MEIHEHLLQVADTGLAIATIVEEENVYDYLNVLLSIEDTLDKGRILVSLSGGDTSQIPAINKKMDALRREISLIVDRCDKSDFQKYMEARARALQYRFNG